MNAVEAHSRRNHWSLFVKKPKTAMKAVEAVKDSQAVETVKNIDPIQAARKLGRMRRIAPNAVTRTVGRTALLSSKHAPAILFGVGVVGVVATTVSACRATLKVEAVLEEIQRDIEKCKTVVTLERTTYSQKDYKRDVFAIRVRGAKDLAQMYAPAILLGTLSITALTTSHTILNRRNIALTAAYAALERGYREYDQRVKDAYGEDRARELRLGSTTTTVVEDTPEGPVKVPITRADPNGYSPYARFFDEYSRNWNRNPEYNHLFLRVQQNFANDMLQSKGHVFLNEVYDMLGIERSQAGAVVGWLLTPEGDNYVDFGIFDGSRDKVRDFVNGREGSILLDFNVDGLIYDKIGSKRREQ